MPSRNDVKCSMASIAVQNRRRKRCQTVPRWCRERAKITRECVIRMTSQNAKSSSKCDEKWVTTLGDVTRTIMCPLPPGYGSSKAVVDFVRRHGVAELLQQGMSNLGDILEAARHVVEHCLPKRSAQFSAGRCRGTDHPRSR